MRIFNVGNREGLEIQDFTKLQEFYSKINRLIKKKN